MEMHVGQFFSECLLCWVLTVLPSHKCYSSWVISRGQSRGSLWREKKALAQVPIYVTLYTRQQKRHRYKEQTFGLCGKRQGWDDLREQHWNMYITICEIHDLSKFDAWNRALNASALGWPWGMGWGGSWEGGSGWGTHIHLWLIHVKVWQKTL